MGMYRVVRIDGGVSYGSIVLAFLCELFLGETQLVCKILNRFKWLLRQSVYDLSKLSSTQEICAVDVNKINKV